MSRIIPTAAGVENVLKLLGHKWHGNWQRRAMQHMMENEKVTIQFARQAGKGFTMMICCVAALLGGLTVTIAMPTLTQSQRILFRTIKNSMIQLEVLFGSQLKCIRNTESEMLWNNGAELRALSSNEASQKEGYTSDWVIVDEAHNALPALLALFNPYMTQARRRGTAKIILNGIGGHPGSVIEAMKERGFAALLIKPEEIIADNPSYKPVFDEARQLLSDDEWNQHYECLSVMEGTRYLFPILQPPLVLPDYDTPRFYFGIDVGRTSDNTVVSVVEGCAGNYNHVEEMRMSGTDFLSQSVRIHRFIDKFPYVPQNVAIEVNGLGIGLYDVLSKAMYGIQPVSLNYELKRLIIFQIQKLVRDRKIGFADERARKELEDVTFEMKENYKYIYAHSDTLSALIMAFCATQKAVKI